MKMNEPRIARAWGRAPVAWVCPVCHRDKMQIMKKEKNGGRENYTIVKHHDHFDDWIKSHFPCVTEVGEINSYLRDQLNIMRDDLRSFHDVLICADCNNLDTTAKRHFEAPKYFSFGPLTLRKIFRSFEWNPPQYDLLASGICQPWLRAYEDRKRHAEARLKKIRQIAERMAEWKEPAPRNDTWYDWARLQDQECDGTMRDKAHAARERVAGDGKHDMLMELYWEREREWERRYRGAGVG